MNFFFCFFFSSKIEPRTNFKWLFSDERRIHITGSFTTKLITSHWFNKKKTMVYDQLHHWKTKGWNTYFLLLTWMEDFPKGRRVVAMVLEKLWYGCEVSSKFPPVWVKVVEFQGVWTSAGQERVAARGAQRLLRKHPYTCSQRHNEYMSKKILHPELGFLTSKKQRWITKKEKRRPQSIIRHEVNEVTVLGWN